MDATSLQWYSSGVVKASECSSNYNHVVLLVGYDTSDAGGAGSWILKNSW